MSDSVAHPSLNVISGTDALPAILCLSSEQLAGWLKEQGQPAFRRRQIEEWMIQRRVSSFDEMTDLPQALRDKLKASFRFASHNIIGHQIASDRTEKLLLQLSDGELVECVLMRDPGRRTVCISTQVGCAMGCVFCA
ncbi:MAG: 23S rRNA (adenine(2503)-C(2))-methyltransferase RlmN, partial [Planctomycetaceae bacterium]|nr:23S rRNA (adenine(2503)-C(2))-methyltransferase RlmN [Planctomycetaceae bacterium]